MAPASEQDCKSLALPAHLQALPLLALGIRHTCHRHFGEVSSRITQAKVAADHTLALWKNSFIGRIRELLLASPLRDLVCEADRRAYQLGVWRSREKRRLSNNMLASHKFAAIIPGDSVAGLVVSNGLSSFLSIYNTVLIVRLILTWFPNPPEFILNPISTICDPYLNLFRGLIPPLGGMDFSPILAFLVLDAFTTTAAALPAELPPSIKDDGAPVTTQNPSKQSWRQRYKP